MLLPALIFVTFAASGDLNWKRILQCALLPLSHEDRCYASTHVKSVWPMIVVALAVHLPSLFFGLLSTRWASAPTWLAESLTFNK